MLSKKINLIIIISLLKLNKNVIAFKWSSKSNFYEQ